MMINIRQAVFILNNKGHIDKNNPNHEGYITGESENYYYITNMNMPYCGTFANTPIHKSRIIFKGTKNDY